MITETIARMTPGCCETAADDRALQSASRLSPKSSRKPHAKGFTLLELMIVMAIMGVLITIAQPNLKNTIVRARESVLKEDLFQMREAIDQYYADHGKYPPSISDLINTQEKSKSYLRDIPRDPMTNAVDWIVVAPEGSEDGAVFDVHSASPLIALDGTPYNTW